MGVGYGRTGAARRRPGAHVLGRRGPRPAPASAGAINPLTDTPPCAHNPPHQIHIIPEAVTELNEVMDFPIGGTAVLFGILALVIMDSSLTAFWAPEVRAG